MSSSVTFRDRVTVDMDTQSKVAMVTLNRPEKLNALDKSMFIAIKEAAAHLKNDTSVRVVMLKGSGRGFCAGLDFKSVMSDPFVMNQFLDRSEGQVANLAQNAAWAWRTLPVPVIALVHGVCFGGGLQIALGADFRFAHPESRLSVMEAKLGLIPDMGGSVFLRELVNIDTAKMLTMTAQEVTGVQAGEMGLVTYCGEDFKEKAHALAKDICARSPDAVCGAKQLFQSTWETDDAQALKIETAIQKQILLLQNTIVASSKAMKMPIPLSFKDRQRVWDNPEQIQH